MPTADWALLTDSATGLSYYANLATRETTWRAPPGIDEPLIVPTGRGWVQLEDAATGSLYYFHKASGTSSWKMPAIDACDATAFEAGLRDEPEGTGEEEYDDDDNVDDGDSDSPSESSSSAISRRPSSPVVDDKAAKRAARRLKILEEILLSERTYVHALSMLRKVYLVPLRTVADHGKPIFTHHDLDEIFGPTDLIIKVNEGFLNELETELRLRGNDYGSVSFGHIIMNAARQLKGCYTRYVTNYDTAEAHLTRLESTDKQKQRYLEVCKTHPEAGGLDLRSFLIQPVQRVPRYRMLLEDLLAHTDADHADEVPLREALTRICEVAMHINEEKRHLDEVERMRLLVNRFVQGKELEKELVSYERRLLKEGMLSKVRRTNRQQRALFLCNDVLIYAAKQTNPSQRGLLSLKGKIYLYAARIHRLPSTEATPHAFAVVAGGGKGYTWLAETAEECKEWFDEISRAIDTCAGRGRNDSKAASMEDVEALKRVPPKTLSARLDSVRGGSLLTKYNQRDGRSSLRWVSIVGDTRIMWGDARSRKQESALFLGEGISLLHGAQSSAFFKHHGVAQSPKVHQSFRLASTSFASGGGAPPLVTNTKQHEDWQCFSIVFKERTLDFAADRPDVLLDWYLAIAYLMPHSQEKLLDEAGLRARVERMMMA